MKRFISIFLLTAMLASMAACGDNSGNGSETTSGSSDDTTTVGETESQYDYPELDFGKNDFNILNVEPTWSMYTYLDFEAMTGETIDDAIYNRNRNLEDKYNFKLNVVEQPIGDLVNTVQLCVAANDNDYHVAYIRGNTVSSAVSGGLCANLYEVPNLQLDQPWWNQSIVQDSSIGTNNDTLYFVMNDLSLCSFDLTWTVFFNETMMKDLGQEMPYDLVREGKWTLDTFHDILKVGTNLNGDSSFAFSESGSAIYGFTSFYRMVDAMIVGAGNKLTVKDKDGIPKLNIENDAFYTTAEKLASIFGSEGDYLTSQGGNGHYEKIFLNGRALFCGAEVKASSVFREMVDDFGILPLPKLDENQESYYGWMNFDTPTMIIPASNSQLEETSIILDALSYLSYTDVLPKYYEIRVNQKGLRNNDSIEMLAIVRNSLTYDSSLTYGWTADLSSSLEKEIEGGGSSIASIIAAAKDGIVTKIEKTFENIE